MFQAEQEDRNIQGGSHKAQADFMIGCEIENGSKAGNAAADDLIGDQKAVEADCIETASGDHGKRPDAFAENDLTSLFFHNTIK